VSHGMEWNFMELYAHIEEEERMRE
jgi:hypothetical protein